ncbi:anti sigma factor C-terminal domain-containing protein [Streptococcus halotolerans]|uniref:anti sigma factor C-terminal domain-containing protein n=1 Tax=Streptococcus halotolerans TaxID=1814128 RepID=UPI0007876C1C|nr:anti sigma factor C-terminal domain-containing protein [Streptococcus halotolerans]
MNSPNHFEKIAKKSKRKHTIKTVIYSSILAILALGLGVKGLTELTSKNGRRILEGYEFLNNIAYPNMFYKNYYFNASGLFSGEFQSNRVKNIDGIEVPFEPMKVKYSLTQGSSHDSTSWGLWDSKKTGVYSQGQHLKIPVFYNINHSYTGEVDPVVTKDLNLIPKMTNQAVEVAVTFDKPYTYSEIQKMVPKNVLVNWYWIGSKSQFDTTQFATDHTLGVMGDDEGKLTPSAFKQFRQHLKKGSQSSWLDSSYNSTGNKGVLIKDEAKAYVKRNKTLKEATFSGILISGRSENLAKLKDREWVFASNIGQSVQIQPYHRLTK